MQNSETAFYQTKNLKIKRKDLQKFPLGIFAKFRF